jgi:hypothetical protein
MSARALSPSEEQAIRDARNARVRASLGLASIPPADWTYEQRTAYNKALAAAILADASSPVGAVSPQELATAQRVSEKEYGPLERYALGDQVGDFFGELVSQAEQINPLSEQNRGKTVRTLSAIAAIAAVVFFAVLAFRTDPRRNGVEMK